MQLARKVRTKIECAPAWRFSASLKSVVSIWLVKPQHHHASETEALAYAGLSQDFAASIVDGRVRELDVQLAACVATGALRSEPIVESLCASFLVTFKENLRMYKRPTSSRHGRTIGRLCPVCLISISPSPSSSSSSSSSLSWFL